MKRYLRLGNVARQVAIASDEMYPAIGIDRRRRWDKELQDKASLIPCEELALSHWMI